jgi:hypothetical protein
MNPPLPSTLREAFYSHYLLESLKLLKGVSSHCVAQLHVPLSSIYIYIYMYIVNGYIHINVYICMHIYIYIPIYFCMLLREILK